MENTGKVLFDDNTPQWYVAIGNHWIGPLSADDVYMKVVRQEITWAHYVWKPGQADWQRICDTKTFKAAVPTVPSKTTQKEVVRDAKERTKETNAPGAKASSSARASVKPAKRRADARSEAARDPDEEKIWYLHYKETQYGPFSTNEVRRFIQVGKVHGRVYIWSDGMTDWDRLENLELFAEDFKAAPAAVKKAATRAAAAQAKADKRTAPRKPLVAKIVMANQEAVTVAMCRDISIGGMQVLTDKIPGEVGTKIRMNVSPVRSGKDKSEFTPFVAEGVIVRVLEDERGFSFRFEKLSDSARHSIETFIKSAR